VSGRAKRKSAEPLLHLLAILLEALALEQEILVELLDQALKLLAQNKVAEAAHILNLYLSQGMAPVEQRQEEQRSRRHRHGALGKVARIAQEHHLAPARNDGNHLDRS
jgi:hypothetical protein